MNKTINEMVALVRTAINESGVNDGEFVGNDEQELTDLIKERLPEAVDFVHSGAALPLMYGDVVVSSSTDDGFLPVAGMLRFIKACDEGSNPVWKKAVTELIDEGSEEEVLAKDEYVGASGERPVAILGQSQDGASITLYPTPQEGCVYVIAPCNRLQNSVDIDSNMLDAVVNYTAGLVLLSLHDERGDNMIGLARNEMGMVDNNANVN